MTDKELILLLAVAGIGFYLYQKQQNGITTGAGSGYIVARRPVGSINAGGTTATAPQVGPNTIGQALNSAGINAVSQVGNAALNSIVSALNPNQSGINGLTETNLNNTTASATS